MAKTAVAALPSKAAAELKELREFKKVTGKELTSLRRGLADALGTAEAAKAALDEIRAVAKEANERTKKLVRDPIYSVPSELKRRVEALETALKDDLKKLRVQVSTRATAEQLDGALERIAKMEGNLAELAETQGDHVDRIAALEEEATKPDEHADPPAHPAPGRDPRQTDLEEAIERSKTQEGQAESKTFEQRVEAERDGKLVGKGNTIVVGGLKTDPLDEGAREVES